MQNEYTAKGKRKNKKQKNSGNKQVEDEPLEKVSLGHQKRGASTI